MHHNLLDTPMNTEHREGRLTRPGRWLLLFDLVLYPVVFILFLVFRPDVVVLAAWVFAPAYCLLTKRSTFLRYLMLATAIGCIWMILSKSYVKYEVELLTIGGYQVFIMFAWAVGLFFTDLMYSNLRTKSLMRNYYVELLLFWLVFSVLLLFWETVGYHVCGIHNVLAKSYAGLPLLDCLHGPVWVKCGYFVTGPVYFVIRRALWQ